MTGVVCVDEEGVETRGREFGATALDWVGVESFPPLSVTDGIFSGAESDDVETETSTSHKQNKV